MNTNGIQTITSQSEIESTLTNNGVSIEGIDVSKGMIIIPLASLTIQPVHLANSFIEGRSIYIDTENILIWTTSHKTTLLHNQMS